MVTISNYKPVALDYYGYNFVKENGKKLQVARFLT